MAPNVRRFFAAAAMGVLFFTASCAVNPVTGENQLALVSEAQEVEMGRSAAQDVQQTMAMVDDPGLQAYVDRLGRDIAARSERPELPWSFKVVDDATPNAFALPGGFIYLTRGMLTLMDSEAELVTVLGHEVGHVTARHSVSQISRAQLAQLGLGLGTILVPELRPFGDLAGTGLGLLLLKFGRDAERQADELGFKYAGIEGYEQSEMADVFVALQRTAELEERSALPSWLATHPAPEERAQAVQARLRDRGAAALDGTVGRAEYLAQIDGLPYGENPRNGFFRRGTFYHPDLEFQFAVPPDWKTQNLSQAVLAMSPERDAAVQLTMARDVEPREALRQFFAQNNLQPVTADTDRIHGVAAAVGSFRAQTQQGAIAAYVAFLRHEGRTYRLVTYAPAQAFGAREATFKEVIGSFAPLRDRDILGVRPPKLEIVRLSESMTLAEFNRKHPSSIPIEQLAIINQVDGPSARITAGTPLKRVSGDALLTE
jgi:predicted Zn-dependent protease